MGKSNFWIKKVADRVERNAFRRKGEGSTIVCASGISPSGPIHLGNFREIMTVHLIAEELKLRGREVDHVHSWDDFDRFRKVPFGVPQKFEQYIGNALADIPDPFGKYSSYVDRYMIEFVEVMEQLGIQPRYVRQSEAYRSGQYRQQIKLAMEERTEIFDILAQYQTPGFHDEPEEVRRRKYYPFQPYCEVCHKDFTNVTGYDKLTATIEYECEHCNHQGSYSLDDKVEGKLVWKVDWPMRWSYEQVDFEPGGEDHSAPGSSFTVGRQIVRDVYETPPPSYLGYAFVGTHGQAKMSGSKGRVLTPADAIEVMEPCILRWLFVRKNANRKFTLGFGEELLRIYDEWDRFQEKVLSGHGTKTDQYIYRFSTKTSSGPVGSSAVSLPFRLLSSTADITQGKVDQILRIVSDYVEDPYSESDLKERLEPRLSCAISWSNQYLPDDDRTIVRDSFAHALYAQLDDEQKKGLFILVDRLDEHWSLEGITALVYGVPKLLHGLPMNAKPTKELKKAQREFFITLYSLICGDDTGPRLPTLFLSLGKKKVRSLLIPSD